MLLHLCSSLDSIRCFLISLVFSSSGFSTVSGDKKLFFFFPFLHSPFLFWLLYWVWGLSVLPLGIGWAGFWVWYWVYSIWKRRDGHLNEVRKISMILSVYNQSICLCNDNYS